MNDRGRRRFKTLSERAFHDVEADETGTAESEAAGNRAGERADADESAKPDDDVGPDVKEDGREQDEEGDEAVSGLDCLKMAKGSAAEVGVRDTERQS